MKFIKFFGSFKRFTWGILGSQTYCSDSKLLDYRAGLSAFKLLQKITVFFIVILIMNVFCIKDGLSFTYDWRDYNQMFNSSQQVDVSYARNTGVNYTETSSNYGNATAHNASSYVYAEYFADKGTSMSSYTEDFLTSYGVDSYSFLYSSLTDPNLNNQSRGFGNFRLSISNLMIAGRKPFPFVTPNHYIYEGAIYSSVMPIIQDQDANGNFLGYTTIMGKKYTNVIGRICADGIFAAGREDFQPANVNYYYYNDSIFLRNPNSMAYSSSMNPNNNDDLYFTDKNNDNITLSDPGKDSVWTNGAWQKFDSSIFPISYIDLNNLITASAVRNTVGPYKLQANYLTSAIYSSSITSCLGLAGMMEPDSTKLDKVKIIIAHPGTSIQGIAGDQILGGNELATWFIFEGDDYVPACNPSITPTKACSTDPTIITSCDDGCGGTISGCTLGTCPCPAGQAVDPATSNCAPIVCPTGQVFDIKTNACIPIPVFKTIFKDFVCLKNSAGVCVGSTTNFYYKEQ